MMRVVNVKPGSFRGLDPLVDPSARPYYNVLFAIAISLLDSDMLLPRQQLCICLLCLDYLFLLPQTVPPSLGIALARLILSSFPLSSLSSLILFLPRSLFFLSPSLPLLLSPFI